MNRAIWRLRCLSNRLFNTTFDALYINTASIDHLLHNCPSNSELLGFLLHIPHKFLGPDLLLETAFRIKLSKSDIAKYARKASIKDASVAGLPFEPGLENLKVGQNQSTSSLPSLKSLSGISKRVKPHRANTTGPHTLPKASHAT